MKLRLNRILLIICLINVHVYFNAQVQIHDYSSTFIKIFDSNLKEIHDFKNVIGGKPLIVISNKNCGGCVDYFIKGKKYFKFLFILNSESLLEVQKAMRIYDLKKENVFFSSCEYIIQFNDELCSKPTPCLISQNESTIYFYDYPLLDSFSKEFTLKHSKFLSQIKKNN